ncbi:MAG: hypothetical protein JNM20_13265 [Rhizobiales bacterium]|nr:hypothetical protein [Hyphomicrobiales bacterium]
MLSEITRGQIDGLALTRRDRLVICDVDEVVVHFTRALEAYLGERDLWLDTSSFALNGNVRRQAGNEPLPASEVGKLIDDFFITRTRHMEPIDGAIDSLLAIAVHADIVLLTNLPHHSGEARRENLRSLGLEFPVITNSGPKGPAIKTLAAMVEGPVVFIDDSPSFIASAYEHAPHARLVHFLHDERFARHLEPVDYVSLRTDNWDEARPHIIAELGGSALK